MKMRPELCTSAVEAIGNTPLIDLARLTRDVDGRILAKLEYFNPGYSKKDRIARQIIADAQASGELSPGQTVVELTSGNTGTGLAIVCGIKGYPFVAVMSKGNSIERARMMSALGAEVVLVDQLPGSVPGQVSGADLELVEKETRQIVTEREAFRADQFRLKSNFRAHYLNTGPEIIRQSAGQIDLFCDFAGTGGSYAGCTAALKEHNPMIKCFIVEPEGAAILGGEPVTHPNHRIQGGGYAIADLLMLKAEQIDGYLKVTDEQAIQMARRLAKEEGIFAGFSSGANVAAAMQLIQTSFKGKTAVVLICDSGLKYLSTDLWE
jgi:cysteine synthase A